MCIRDRGILKAKRGVHEVINTIMMNFIAYALVAFVITGPLKAPGKFLNQPIYSKLHNL